MSKRLRGASFGPYAYPGDAWEITERNDVSLVETDKITADIDGITFHDYTASSILGLDGSKKTKSMTQEEVQAIVGNTDDIWKTGNIDSASSYAQFINDTSVYKSIYQKTGLLKIIPLNPSGGTRDAWAEVVVSSYGNSEGPICTLLGSKNAYAGTAAYGDFGTWYTSNALAYGLNIVVSSSGSNAIRIWWTDTSGSTNANLVLRLQVLGDL